MDIQKNLKTIRSEIERGILKEARLHIREAGKEKLSRRQRLELATVARRAGMADFSLRLLNAVIRPKAGLPNESTPEEKTVYAASLIALGQITEALGLLDGLETQAAPKKRLFQSHALFTQWEYKRAIPVLRRYVNQDNISIEDKLIGELNLAAALVYEKEEDAEPLLQKLLQDTREQNLGELYANVLELCAQYSVGQKDWMGARTWLSQSKEILEGTGTQSELFVYKWLAIVELLEKKSSGAREKLNRVRKMARNVNHWETLRDCDFFEAVTFKQKEKLFHVYFGTPYEAFRKRLFLDFGEPIDLPETYLWDLSQDGKGAVIDLWENSLDGFAPGKTIFKAARVLVSDFYRPFPSHLIHCRLYPESFYNPVSSPKRVQMAISSLRKWLARHQSALTLKYSSEGYYFSSQAGAKLLVPRHDKQLSKTQLDLESIRREYAYELFSAKQAAATLGTSTRTVTRVLREMVDSGHLLRFGAGKNTTYQLKEEID